MTVCTAWQSASNWSQVAAGGTVLYCPYRTASRTHSSLRKESPAQLMLLTLVWDETASGTARSKTEN